MRYRLNQPDTLLNSCYTEVVQLKNCNKNQKDAFWSLFDELCDSNVQWESKYVESKKKKTSDAFKQKWNEKHKNDYIVFLKNVEDIIGMLRFCSYDDDEKCFWINGVVITMSMRGNHLGHILMQRAKEECGKLHPGWPIALQVFSDNVAAIKLYEAFGFTHTWSKVLVCVTN